MTKTNSSTPSSIVHFRVTSGALILATLLAGCGGGGSTPTDNNPPPTNNKMSRTLTFTGIPADGEITRSVGSDPFTITITVSAGTGDITYTSSDPAVATVDGATGEVTLLTVGTTTITATLAADDTYNAATVSFTLTVEAASPPTPPIIPATQSAMAFHTAPLTEAIVIENTGAALADDGCQFVDAADSSTTTTNTAGLSIAVSGNNCHITGTPRRSDQATAGTPEVVTLFIRAFNTEGSDWTTLTLTITEPVIDLSDQADSVELTTGVLAETITFASTGNFVIPDDGCNISPALPEGLTLSPTSDKQSCQITGTPTETRATITYAVTGRNGLIADSSPAQLTLAVRLPAMQIQTGRSHSCLLNPTGEIWCWGLNANRQLGTGDNLHRERPTRAGAESNWRSLSVGNNHNCAINASAQLWCWGGGGSGRLGTSDTDDQDTPVRVGMQTDWRSVSAGGAHTCGIRGDGTDQTLWCWGAGGSGQLGRGDDTSDPTTPMQVGTATNWHSVSAGDAHTCGIRDEGADQTLWCWGLGGSGQLGMGSAASPNIPMQVGTATNWHSVSAGGSHTCGIQDDGADQTLWCWGLGSFGQLGTGSTASPNIPTPVGENTDWHSVSAGSNHTCGIRDDGTDQTLSCWGSGSSGQLGTGTRSQRTPTQEMGEYTDWHSVSAGSGHTCGIRGDGTDQTLWCWGLRSFGRLGTGNIGNRIIPTQVGTNTTWNGISAGQNHTCGIRADKTLWCWGSFFSGRLGTGSTTNQNTPTLVMGGYTDWLSVSAGSEHTCGIRDDDTDQTLWCWGESDNGRLGRGSSTTDLTTPMQVGANTDWQSVSAGEFHTCGIRGDGTNQTLWCWGSGGSGQLGTGNISDQNTPTQVDEDGDADWHSVSAGSLHTCGIRAEQTLWCWGNGGSGRLGSLDSSNQLHEQRNAPTEVGSNTDLGKYTDWHSVSAGSEHTCGIRDDETNQTLWCWGRGDDGRLGTGSFLNRSNPRLVLGFTTASLVDSGGSHACAISTVGSNNSLFCWGDVTLGRLGIGDVANFANTPLQTLFAIESLVTPATLADAIDTTEIAFNLLGTHSWMAQTAQANDNTDAAATTNAAENDLACITSYVEDAGTLSFYWRVSSEMDSDFLNFYINTFETRSISGMVDWAQVDAISVIEDSELRWCYEKDGNEMTANEDGAFLDQVVFTSQ